MHVRFAVEALIRQTERSKKNERPGEWLLRIPEGFLILEKPLPTTRQDLEIEPDAVMNLEIEVTEARPRAPPGQEPQNLGFHIVELRSRRWPLERLKRG